MWTSRDRFTAVVGGLAKLDPSLQVLEELQPLFEMLVPLKQQIDAADDRTLRDLAFTVPGAKLIARSARRLLYSK